MNKRIPILIKWQCILLITTAFINNVCRAQPKIGAYYFDGWTSATDPHLTKELVKNFPNREPKWGWVTSTIPVMHDQIDLAADAGLYFFSFCWYYNSVKPQLVGSLNQALDNYLHASNKSRLKFCLMVANHTGFELGPKDWDAVTASWLKLFKDRQYLKVDGRPLIIFFSINTLINKFGSTMQVANAFKQFKEAATSMGLEGVTIAACLPPNIAELNKAQACGVDVFTGYNYHNTGFKVDPQKSDSPGFSTQAIPISSMIKSDTLVWNRIAYLAKKPYIPTSTLNWDPRGWANQHPSYLTDPYYTGYSASSVAQSVKGLINWINKHPANTTQERFGVLYAWNEYGEGAWLTPSKNDNSLLDAVKSVIK